MGKIALKKLTASDLTLFEWQFRERNAGNQKAINLNANVFVDQLFPSIEDATLETDGRLPLDLWVFGPGRASGINLQRKIIKGGAYKNWRLNGEFINNPPDQPDRFNILAPDDYVFFSFEGAIVPTSATAVFVAAALVDDLPLHAACNALGMVGRNTMMALDEGQLLGIASRAGLAADHPLMSLALSADLQEAATGSAHATERILRSGRAPQLSASALRKARDAAEEIGRLGEALIAIYLQRQKAAGAIADFEWVSSSNAVAPLDFRRQRQGAAVERIDVKATSGPFDREFHISFSELRAMAESGDSPYYIYRVFGATKEGAKLRVSDNMKPFAEGVLRTLAGLPLEVTIDAVSVSPRAVRFGGEIELTPAEDDESA